MEITLEAIISLVGLFIGGTGITGFFFWRQHRRKEEAEAKLAEAEAKLKEAGKIRLEGKDYQPKDGDIMFFRFNN